MPYISTQECFAIHSSCLSIFSDFKKCAADWTCNELTVRNYLKRYVTKPDATCETYARTHVGGPSGINADYTIIYWNKVEDCLLNNLTTIEPHYLQSLHHNTSTLLMPSQLYNDLMYYVNKTESVSCHKPIQRAK